MLKHWLALTVLTEAAAASESKPAKEMGGTRRFAFVIVGASNL